MNENYQTMQTTANIIEVVKTALALVDTQYIEMPSQPDVVVNDIQAAVARQLR